MRRNWAPGAVTACGRVCAYNRRWGAATDRTICAQRRHARSRDLPAIRAGELRVMKLEGWELEPVASAGDGECREREQDHGGDDDPEHVRVFEEADLKVHAHDACQYRGR